jgi:4-hydroxy-tetrahydrodipicolinate synthase
MFRGVIAALVTPLTADGEVARHDVARLIASLRPYVTGVVPALSTGEGWALSTGQWNAMVAASVRAARGLPVLAGALRPTTAGVLELAGAAARHGADAIVATAPYGRDVSQEEMYRHYLALSERAGLPVVVYHEIHVSANSIEPDTLLRVCALPGVVAVKDSAGAPEATERLVAARPGVPILQGLEHLLPRSGDLEGHVVALANVEPELCRQVWWRVSGQPGAGTAAAATAAARLTAAIERYGLDRPDWYRVLKTELRRRGILTTDRCVELEGGTPCTERPS